MTDFSSQSVYGITDFGLSNLPFSSASPALDTSPKIHSGNDLLRLFTLHDHNERLLNELKSLRTRLNHAQAYLDSPSRNPALAIANVNHLKAKHSAALASLRSSRREAHELLMRLEG